MSQYIFTGRRIFLSVAALGLVLSAGCVSPWWNGFLNPTELGNFRENRISEILRSVSFRDKPAGIAGTVDPSPEDLVATIEPYKTGPGDMLEIRILDLLARDTESTFTPRVDELGYISVPPFDRIHVEGLSASDIEQHIKNLSIEKGIFMEDSSPTITVNYVEQRQRTYTLSGSIATQGKYPMPSPDYRLREAILAGGGLQPLVQWVYVIRDEPRPKRVIGEGTETMSSSTEEASSATEPPPVAPISLAEISGGSAGGTTRPARTTDGILIDDQQPSAQQRERAVQELIEAVAPPLEEDSRAESAEPTDTQPEEVTPSKPPFIFVNDRFIEAPSQRPEAEQKAQETRPSTTPAPAPEPEEVDWEELVSETQQRIIKIPADALRQGKSDYNIVIKPGDTILLDMGPTGSYYVMGHVRTPGFRSQQSYDFNGQEVSLRQAIASVGGLDDLAWPSRCEVHRRLDNDRVEITQWDLARIMDGRDPDIYLKPGDVINVGTHAIARLLAQIRNGFRFGYGVDFSYSRNFADIDSFAGKANPEALRRASQQARFPGLF